MPPPIPPEARYLSHSMGNSLRPRGRRLPRKKPGLAMVLSIFPGLGQCYNGDFMKGLLIFLTSILIFPWILGIIDAYFKAKMINRKADTLQG